MGSATNGTEPLLLTGVYNAKGIGKVQAYDSLGQAPAGAGGRGERLLLLVDHLLRFPDGRDDLHQPDPNNPASNLHYKPWTIE